MIRDISTPGPAAATTPRRPDRNATYRPPSDAYPLLLGHGGVLTVDRLGTVPYVPTWELQDELAEQRRGRRIGDRLLLLEHFPVYTLGRGGDASNLLASRERLREIGAELVRIDRGGDITFHGPGQIVAYPILELKDPLDLRRYVRTLEAAIIDTAAAFSVAGERLDRYPGIWVDGERKLGAVGVRVKRGVTTHGLALNVNTELRWFDEMIPAASRTRGHLAGPRARPPDPDGRGRGRARPSAGAAPRPEAGGRGRRRHRSRRRPRAVSDEVVVQREGSPADDPAHGIRIETGSFGPWETNAYLVWDGRSTHALVVDPGWAPRSH